MTRLNFFQAIAAAVTGTKTLSGAQMFEPDEPANIKEVPAGKLYALEYPGTLSERSCQHIRESLKPFEDRFNCKFMVLEDGMKLRDPSAPVTVNNYVRCWRPSRA